MKKRIYYLSFVMLMSVATLSLADDKPVQHLKVEDITTASEADSVFNQTTLQLKSMQSLNEQELHDIHMITYSLEKAIAYYVVNSNGDQKMSAEKIAEVVEQIHLASENGKQGKVRTYLDEYFELADQFAKKR